MAPLTHLPERTAGEHHFAIEAIHQLHKAALDIAHAGGLPITVHAGEDGTAENVETAVDAYHARRIGHGYHLLDNGGWELVRVAGGHP